MWHPNGETNDQKKKQPFERLDQRQQYRCRFGCFYLLQSATKSKRPSVCIISQKTCIEGLPLPTFYLVPLATVWWWCGIGKGGAKKQNSPRTVRYLSTPCKLAGK